MPTIPIYSVLLGGMRFKMMLYFRFIYFIDYSKSLSCVFSLAFDPFFLVTVDQLYKSVASR